MGAEVGQRFRAFKEVRPPDMNELTSNPNMFNTLNLNAKYMVVAMFSSWVGKSKSKLKKSLTLLEKMSEESKEYISIIIAMMSAGQKSWFISEVMDSSEKVGDSLIGIADIVSKL